ncbi:hypothetical protein SDC9_183112 [bioreactor metagenome]|uniref:Uncharacterized protein n=1 Tax=bioreactor metagenome TaxID=1076179 RepID=A0A645HHM9_9ZZZZ
MEAAVAVRDDPPRQDADHRRCAERHRRIDHAVEPVDERRVVHGDQADGLLVAAGRGGDSGFQDQFQVFAGNRGVFVCSPVTRPLHDGGNDIHGILPSCRTGCD